MIARGLLDNWTVSGVSWIASGNPAELALVISGQDAGNRLLGTYTAGNGAGLQPRFYVNGDAQSAPNAINTAAFIAPAVGDKGPYPRFYLRNPGFQNHDLSVFKNFPLGGNGQRYLQLRFEAFNVLNIAQFSGVNRTTNLTNAAGQTGAAIFNNYTGLTVTNNTRPAGQHGGAGHLLRRVHRRRAIRGSSSSGSRCTSNEAVRGRPAADIIGSWPTSSSPARTRASSRRCGSSWPAFRSTSWGRATSGSRKRRKRRARRSTRTRSSRPATTRAARAS